MRNPRIRLCVICLALFCLLVAIGFFLQYSNGFTPFTISPIQESYEYTIKEFYCIRPSLTNEVSVRETLRTTIEDGTFICLTADANQADEFINAQRTLLHFLQNKGVEPQELKYVATDYDDSFSDSSKNTAYIAFSSIRTYRQVLVTLQALWGDYTDYGYVYAMSNAIADHLDWQTDACEPVERTAMDAFFSGNPDAINLLYPGFTTVFASEEIVNYSKALSISIFDDIDWRAALEKSIDVQLDDYYALISGYAEEIGVPFTRQTCGYAYRGEYLPLCINTAYTQLIVDRNYSDFYSDMYEDYFSDYVSIYQTANIIDRETTEAVEYFGLEDSAGIISINWFSGESAKAQFGKPLVNHYNPYVQEVNVTTINGYLHEYYHHIEHLINPNLGESWQSQAFCEIGRSHSLHSLYSVEKPMTQIKQWVDLFYSCTGRSYQPGVDDYFESYDILCYVTNEFELDYYNGRNATNSFAHYLIDLFGEDAIFNLMLFPDTVWNITEKSWEELEAEWKQYIHDKYEGVEIPNWIKQNPD